MTQNKKKANDIFVIAQQFYGNRTGTTINKENIDYFLRGHLSNYDPADIEDVERKILRLPGSEYLAIIYDQKQEDEYVNVEFPEIVAMSGEKYRERWGEELKMHVSCEIPEMNFKIHTRCIACRVNEQDELLDINNEDYGIIKKYFTI